MKLLASIASYSGETRRKIQAILTDEVMNIIAGIAGERSETAPMVCGLLYELTAMDVLRADGGKVFLNTAVFLERDLEMLYDPVMELGRGLADVVKAQGNGLPECSPAIRNFIGAITGLGQGLGDTLVRQRLAVDWRCKTGRYPKSKVDFNEDCPAYRRFGPDLQNKGVHRGKEYTAVIIGYGNNNYCSCLSNAANLTANRQMAAFLLDLETCLTDAFPRLILGEIRDEALLRAAGNAGIDTGDRSSVVTAEDAGIYQPAIEKISGACTGYFLSRLGEVRALLAGTASGRRGAPPETMMMNLWRLLRRAAAQALYQNGFLTDRVPDDGSITVFYANEIQYF